MVKLPSSHLGLSFSVPFNSAVCRMLASWKKQYLSEEGGGGGRGGGVGVVTLIHNTLHVCQSTL